MAHNVCWDSHITWFLCTTVSTCILGVTCVLLLGAVVLWLGSWLCPSWFFSSSCFSVSGGWCREWGACPLDTGTTGTYVFASSCKLSIFSSDEGEHTKVTENATFETAVQEDSYRGAQLHRSPTARKKLSCEKPFNPAGSESYTGTEAHSLLRKEASNHLSQKTN